jgi:hypothetical protein
MMRKVILHDGRIRIQRLFRLLEHGSERGVGIKRTWNLFFDDHLRGENRLLVRRLYHDRESVRRGNGHVLELVQLKRSFCSGDD